MSALAPLELQQQKQHAPKTMDKFARVAQPASI
jgi:hypothetical protein